MNQTQIQKQKIDNEKMGVNLSQTLEWDGFAILEVSIAALTNANFHTEAKIINRILEKLETDLMVEGVN